MRRVELFPNLRVLVERLRAPSIALDGDVEEERRDEGIEEAKRHPR